MHKKHKFMSTIFGVFGFNGSGREDVISYLLYADHSLGDSGWFVGMARRGKLKLRGHLEGRAAIIVEKADLLRLVCWECSGFRASKRGKSEPEP